MFLTIGPVVLAIYGYFKGRSQKQNLPPLDSAKWNAVPMIINSAVLYALAYNLIYFVQELFLALGKHWIGLKAYLYHNNHNWEGSDPRDALMQGLGALSIFILGALLLLIFFKIRHASKWTSLFILWLAHNGLIQSLPQLSSVPMGRDTDVGQSITYLQLGESMEFLLCYLSVLMIIALSYGFSKWFLSFTPAEIDLSRIHTRFRSIFLIVVLPALIGTVIIFPYKIFPIDRYFMAPSLLLVSIPAIFGFSWLIKKTKRIGSEANERILIMPIVLSLLLLLFFQFILAPGIVFD